MTAPPSAQRRIIVAGTDTGVGKTVFAAALTRALDAFYWKPVQAGIDPASPLGPTDRETVARLSGLAPGRILPEAYRLKMPAAPSIAAAAEGLALKRARLEAVPATPDGRTLVIETAGGLMVPLATDLLQIDLFPAWGGRVVLVARTALGTINHCLLSIAALRARGIDLAGVAFVGEPAPDAETAIVHHGGVRRLGRLPPLARLDADTLAAAFAANFRVEDIAS